MKSRREARREQRRAVDINATISVDGRVVAARTRIQSGFGGDSASGRFAFSG